MGILSDIYVSNEDDAAKYDITPDVFVDRAQFSSLTPLEYSMLWAAIRGVPWEASLLRDFVCVLQQDGGERLIHKFPVAMLMELVHLTTDQTREASAKWAASDELACSPADILPVVEGLKRLADRAVASGRNLYLWNCV